ncbi:MAG: sulfatase-like hydrolase/transferase [Roseibacillus sp.]
MKINLSSRISLVSGLLLSFIHLAQAEAPRPNIIVIMCDDLGYADVGFNGSQDIRTPHLDALAKDGVVCTSGYVAHPFCGPSRMAMMTGRYPHTFGGPFNLPAASAGIEKYNSQGIDPKQKLMSTVLQESGYHTGIIGKWHLGITAEHHPNARGFDDFYGFLAGGHDYFPEKFQPKYEAAVARGAKNIWDYILPLEHNGKDVKETEYLTDGLSREACRFIEDSKKAEKPFFLFLSYNAPHTPMEAKEEDMAEFVEIENKQRRIVAGMVYAVDRGVGKVVETLQKTETAENTLIVFLSDNGGRTDQGNLNTPLRGSKGDTWEGGIRVPMLFHWPAVIKKGRTHQHPVSTIDFYPTFAALAGAKIPEGKKLDGKNLTQSIQSGVCARPGEMLYTIRHRMSKNDTPHHQVGGRRDQWKIYRGMRDWQLFDANSDPGETSNLAAKHPEILKEMVSEMADWAKTHTQPLWFDDLAQEKRWLEGKLPYYEETFSFTPLPFLQKK